VFWLLGIVVVTIVVVERFSEGSKKKGNQAPGLKNEKSGSSKPKKDFEPLTGKTKSEDFDDGIILRKLEKIESPVIDRSPKTKRDVPFSAIKKAFENHGIYSLWHITHRDNVQSIHKEGILSHSDSKKLPRRVKDISCFDVQKRRKNKFLKSGRNVHEYVPTYMKVRNPMYYRVCAEKLHLDELCIVEVSLSALENAEFYFTDGNAASNATKFYDDIDKMDCLPWEVLNDDWWNKFEDGKRKKCAEVLIYPSIAPEHIKCVHCYSDEAIEKLGSIRCHLKKSKAYFF